MKKIIIIICALLLFTSCESADEIISGSSGASPKLHYVYGGVNGESAIEDPMVRISNLTINGRSGMAYSWENGSSLSAWGFGDNVSGAYACIFYLDSNGEWYGGKFDWISTSRRTRDFKNLNSGYGGWNPEKFYAAKCYGFLILSHDGKKRSNFIVQ